MSATTVQGAAAQARLETPISDEAEIREDAGVQFEDTGMPPLLFMSRRGDLRLTKKARYPITGNGGAKVGETAGESVSFRDHMLVVPREGEMTITDMLGAGEWTTDAEEIAEYLRSHRLNGDMFEGFWEVDPVAPQPSESELDALQDAAMRLDEDKLVEIIRREEKGWGRDVVLKTARKTLSKVRTVIAEVREQQEAAETAAAAEAARAPVAQTDGPADTPAPEIPAEPVAEAPSVDTPAAMQAPSSAAGLGENATGDPAPAPESSTAADADTE